VTLRFSDHNQNELSDYLFWKNKFWKIKIQFVTSLNGSFTWLKKASFCSNYFNLTIHVLFISNKFVPPILLCNLRDFTLNIRLFDQTRGFLNSLNSISFYQVDFINMNFKRTKNFRNTITVLQYLKYCFYSQWKYALNWRFYFNLNYKPACVSTDGKISDKFLLNSYILIWKNIFELNIFQLKYFAVSPFEVSTPICYISGISRSVISEKKSKIYFFISYDVIHCWLLMTSH